MAADVQGQQTRYETEGRSVRLDSAEQRTFVYHGAYDTLLGELPEKGERWTVTGVSGTWYVIASQVTRGEDGVMGTMSVTCTDSQLTSPAAGVDPKYTQIEVDFSEVSQPIEHHPDFISAVAGAGVSDAMKHWLKFKASPLKLRLENKYLNDPDDPDSEIKNLDGSLVAWAELYNKGIENYITHLPVVTRIQEYDARPLQLGEALDSKEEPPGSAVTEPSGYGEWLKTCDKASYDSRTGHWTRTEQWTCAAELPSLLYGGSAGA